MPRSQSTPSNPPQYAATVSTADTDVVKLQEDTTFSGWSSISIPSDGTIVGCEVDVTCFSNASLNLIQQQLISVSIDGDTFSGGISPSPGINQSNTLTLSSFGGISELWGFDDTSWSSVNWDDNFSVKYTETVNGNVFYLDRIELKIYYTTSVAGPGTIKISNGLAKITQGRISL